MKRNKIITLGAIAYLGMSLNTMAATDMEDVRDRLTMLENAGVEKGLSIGGEIGITYENTGNKEIVIDTAELSFIYTVDERFQAEIVLEGEDKSDDGNIDNATIGDVVLTGKFDKFGVSIGRYGAPFAASDTAFISGALVGRYDPTVKALSVNTELNGVSAIAWIEPNSTGDNNGLSVSYEADNFTVGIDTIKHAGLDRDKATNTATVAMVGRGTSIYGQVSFADVTLIAERTKVKNGDTVTQFEAQYALDDLTLMARADNSNAANDTDDATLIGATYDLAEGVSLAIENKNPKATGEKSVTTVQLVYTF
ncbi:hypothetical protein SPONN_2712 [uncultured Candidatus Thioglobus sp.]|nr:hypothetical protein SPONN_2712 [uncultured Candidatus Thioglobus sp.]